MRNLILTAITLLISTSAFSAETISFDVGSWYFEGRVATRKGVEIKDVNKVLGTQLTLKEVAADLEKNGCHSNFIKLSVQAMIYAYGDSMRVSPIRIDVSSEKGAYKWKGGYAGCQYEWIEARQAYCHKGDCILE